MGDPVKLEALRAAHALLAEGEVLLPDGVLRTIDCLSSLGVWFRLSRNRPALSCRDAARKRRRLGSEGIEIWNELKSWLGSYEDSNRERRTLLVHCRGDRELDHERLRNALGNQTSVSRLGQAEVEQLGVAYGLINPFATWCTDPAEMDSLVQVFDEEITHPLGEVGTMMTNAGDHTWGVEFDAQQLASRLPRARIARIAIADPEPLAGVWGPRVRTPITILTGNAPESGIYLWI